MNEFVYCFSALSLALSSLVFMFFVGLGTVQGSSRKYDPIVEPTAFIMLLSLAVAFGSARDVSK